MSRAGRPRTVIVAPLVVGSMGSCDGGQTRELCIEDYHNVSTSCPVTVADIEQCTNEGVGPPVCSTVPAACFAIVPCVLAPAMTSGS